MDSTLRTSGASHSICVSVTTVRQGSYLYPCLSSLQTKERIWSITSGTMTVKSFKTSSNDRHSLIGVLKKLHLTEQEYSNEDSNISEKSKVRQKMI